MGKYSVLLVDDEEAVIQVILKKINWEELGFVVVGYANNGVKALEMVEEYQPDVVMTDIKMPYMDGMELAKHIKEDYPTTKLLIFTGFDEFQYAKEAVHLEVEEYILKPANSVELTKVFTQLREKLNQEISEKRNTETLQKYYMESLPMLQSDFYSSLIEGKLSDEDIAKYISDYQIDLNGPFYCCLVVHTSSNHVPEDMTAALLATSVQKQAKEYFEKNWKSKCFSYHENIVIVAQLNNETENSDLTDDCDKFCRYAKRIIGAVVTVGIGNVCSNIKDLDKSYSSAREAVSYRVIYGTSKAINIMEIAPKEINQTGSSSDDELANLFKMIRLGSEEKVKEAAKVYLKHISSSSKSIQQHYIDIMELVGEMYRFSKNNDLIEENSFGDISKLYGKLLEYEADTLEKWVIDTCLSIRSKIINARSQSTKSFVAKAKEYVRDNFSDEALSLDTVCEALGVSNSYFSTVFKKETGESFIGYLTEYRMNQAANMMINTNEKSYIIAEKVGYTDPNYFSYVFKRQFGVSPSKYRTEHIEGEK